LGNSPGTTAPQFPFFFLNLLFFTETDFFCCLRPYADSRTNFVRIPTPAWSLPFHVFPPPLPVFLPPCFFNSSLTPFQSSVLGPTPPPLVVFFPVPPLSFPPLFLSPACGSPFLGATLDSRTPSGFFSNSVFGFLLLFLVFFFDPVLPLFSQTGVPFFFSLRLMTLLELSLRFMEFFSDLSLPRTPLFCGPLLWKIPHSSFPFSLPSVFFFFLFSL